MKYYLNAKIIHILLSKQDPKYKGCQVETQDTFNLINCILFMGKTKTDAQSSLQSRSLYFK